MNPRLLKVVVGRVGELVVEVAVGEGGRWEGLDVYLRYDGGCRM